MRRVRLNRMETTWRLYRRSQILNVFIGGTQAGSTRHFTLMLSLTFVAGCWRGPTRKRWMFAGGRHVRRRHVFGSLQIVELTGRRIGHACTLRTGVIESVQKKPRQVVTHIDPLGLARTLSSSCLCKEERSLSSVVGHQEHECRE